ncbi:MAG: hypothetical protein V8S24_13475 [Gordonibacter pamelaeae]
MAYIAVGSYVYISFFGLSELEYSVFFAVAALLTAARPFIWLKASRYVSARRFTGILLAAAALWAWPCCWQASSRPCCSASRSSCSPSPEACTAPTARTSCYPSRRATRARRRRSINFAHTAIGCVGMLLAVLPWSSYVQGIGVLIVASMAFAGIGWIALLKSRIPLAGIKDAAPSGQEAPAVRGGRPGQGSLDDVLPRRRGAPGSRRAAAAVRWMRAGWRQEAGAPAGHADAGAPAALPRLRRAGAIGARLFPSALHRAAAVRYHVPGETTGGDRSCPSRRRKRCCGRCGGIIWGSRSCGPSRSRASRCPTASPASACSS